MFLIFIGLNEGFAVLFCAKKKGNKPRAAIALAEEQEKAFFRIAPREKSALLRVVRQATGLAHYDGALPGFFFQVSRGYCETGVSNAILLILQIEKAGVDVGLPELRFSGFQYGICCSYPIVKVPPSKNY